MSLPPGLEVLATEFEISDEIGRGGMAIVYRAIDRSLGREVAVKVLHPGTAVDEEARLRFEREAQVAGRLQHPHIVPVYGVRQLPHGQLALVMRYVRGSTLREHVASNGPLPMQAVVALGLEMASALEYAHRSGIVHRDVKPANIFLDKDTSSALLADFGIAYAGPEGTQLTRTGMSLGTPNYMSPEQIEGQPADPRSDVYSLGLVLWEALSGSQPWAGESLFSIIYKQKHEALPTIPQIRRDTPLWLSQVVERSLTKDPDERWPSMGAFLESWRSGGAFIANLHQAGPKDSGRRTESTANAHSPAATMPVESTKAWDTASEGDAHTRRRTRAKRRVPPLQARRLAGATIALGFLLLVTAGARALFFAPAEPVALTPPPRDFERTGTLSSGKSQPRTTPARPFVDPVALSGQDESLLTAEPPDPTGEPLASQQVATPSPSTGADLKPVSPLPALTAARLVGSSTIRVGETTRIAVGNESVGSVHWQLAPPGILARWVESDRGLTVMGLQEGHAVVRGLAPGASTVSIDLQVRGYLVGDVRIAMPDSIRAGSVLELRASVGTPAGQPLAESVVSWRLLSPGVARIERGLLRGIRPGRVPLVASAGGMSDTTLLRVYRPIQAQTAPATGQTSRPSPPPPPPSPTAALGAAVGQCIGALSSSEAERVRLVFLLTSEPLRDDLVELIGIDGWRVEETEIEGGPPTAIAGRLEQGFRVRGSWESRFGRRQSRWIGSAAVIELKQNRWTFVGCRALGM